MFFTRSVQASLRSTAVRSFGPRSALRAPPAPTSVAAAEVKHQPINVAAATSTIKTDAAQTPASTASATAVPEVGDVSHAFGKARKVGDE